MQKLWTRGKTFVRLLCKNARQEKLRSITELVDSESLKSDAKRFIERSISKGYVEYAGAELDGILPPTSRRQGAREAKKQTVLEKIRSVVEEFIGI